MGCVGWYGGGKSKTGMRGDRDDRGALVFQRGESKTPAGCLRYGRGRHVVTRRGVAGIFAGVTWTGAASGHPYGDKGGANGEGDGNFKFQI
jgi:hypothetical protein